MNPPASMGTGIALWRGLSAHSQRGARGGAGESAAAAAGHRGNIAGAALAAAFGWLGPADRKRTLRAWHRTLLKALRIQLAVTGGDRFAPPGAVGPAGDSDPRFSRQP